MSISVSRESISKLMGELVDTFPMETEGRSSISDFGKLLFTEGQTASSTTTETKSKGSTPTQTGSKRVYTEIKGIPRQKQHDIMKTKDKAVPQRWTPDEDDKLREAVGRHGERNWKSIADEVPGRNHTQCLQRWTKVLAPGLVKGHWRPDEDELLQELVAEGRKNWGQVATRIPGRTSKQCRERWYNHLDPSIIRGEYTQEEDRMILDAQSRLGNRWSAIAAMLPGRTEDAVKIRWKSLCRVRKGHGRRGQTDKGKMTSNSAMGIPKPMMQQGGSGFSEGMVKSEEVAPFSMHSHQMVRLPNVQMVSAMNMHSGSQLGQHHHHPAMIGGNGMMYSSDLRGGGYDPTMAHYRKLPMQQFIANSGYLYPFPPSGSTTSSNAQDFPVERRFNMDFPAARRHNMEYPVERRSNMEYSVERQSDPPSDGMPVSSQAQDGYRQGFSSPTYASNINAGMYITGSSTPRGGMSNGQLYGNRTLQTDTHRPGVICGTHVPSYQPQQHILHSSHGQMMSYNYGMQSGPSLPEDLNGESSASHSMISSSNGMNNPAARFVQQHHRQQEPRHYVDHSPPTRHHQAHEQNQSNVKKKLPVPHQAYLKQSGTSEERTKQESRHGLMSTPSTPSSQAMPNPAATFAHSQADKASPVAGNGNPVAAFLQMQHHQLRKEHPTSASKMAQAGPPRPFNPAAAFAQRFQAGQKAPMPSSNSAGSTKSNDDPANEDDDSENGSGYRTNEPLLKKVKPRLSIDAARASAARRMRTSGSSGNLAGHGSLDVFLNEIGDVGRLSDLKMDEFQTLDDLWRVSGDMDRLSL